MNDKELLDLMATTIRKFDNNLTPAARQIQHDNLKYINDHLRIYFNSAELNMGEEDQN